MIKGNLITVVAHTNSTCYPQIKKGDKCKIQAYLYDRDTEIVRARTPEEHKTGPYYDATIAPKGSYHHYTIVMPNGEEFPELRVDLTKVFTIIE